MTAARGHSCRVVFDRLLNVGAGDPECGRESEKDAHSDGDDQRPAKRCAIEMNGREQRQGDGVLVREIIDDRECDRESDGRAEEREDEALGKELANEPAAAAPRARRMANSLLRVAARPS